MWPVLEWWKKLHRPGQTGRGRSPLPRSAHTMPPGGPEGQLEPPQSTPEGGRGRYTSVAATNTKHTHTIKKKERNTKKSTTKGERDSREHQCLRPAETRNTIITKKSESELAYEKS